MRKIKIFSIIIFLFIINQFIVRCECGAGAGLDGNKGRKGRHSIRTENELRNEKPYQCVLPPSSTNDKLCQSEEAALCQMLKDDEFLSTDAMEGRRTGTRGGAMARQYLIDRLREMGIQPYSTFLNYTQPFNYTYSNGTDTFDGIIGYNVISFVPGTRLDQVIVISAHYDHVGIQKGELYNGADDNASGSSGLLYLAQFFACPTNRPNNSLMFVHFDGEESNGGPKAPFAPFIIRRVPNFPAGSKYFLENPPLPLASIKLDINLDMISRNARGELYVMRSNTSLDQLLNSTITNQQQTNASTVELVVCKPTWERNSDHLNFGDAGIDYVYFAVGPHADYHKPTDDYINIDPQFYMDAIRAIKEIVVKLDMAIFEGQLAE